MYFNISNKGKNDNNQNEFIKFLNTEALDFYNGKCKFKGYDYGTNFKSILLFALIHVERVFRAVFGSDIKLKNNDLDLFKEMFPNACKIFNVTSESDIRKVANILNNIRNINAHELLSQDDYVILVNKMLFLEEQTKLNSSIKYFNKHITVAGIVFIVLNFVRAETIKKMCRQDVAFSIIATGTIKNQDCDMFVDKISKVNLECNIRKKKGSNIYDSIIGEWQRYVRNNTNGEQILIGFEEYPTVFVSYDICEATVTILEGSLTKIYYDKNYKLTIKDEKGFIRLSNELPPFTLIDYCFAIGAEVFDKELTKMLDEKFESISKLNHPKFYTNKNIRTLLLPETISNFILCSEVISGGITEVCSALEKQIFKNKNNFKYDVEKHYSTLKEALSLENVPSNLIKEMNYIRNFAAHGYILGEHLINEGEQKEYNFENVISIFREMIDFFKNTEYEPFIISVIQREFVNRLIGTCYKLVCSSTRSLISGSPDFDETKFKREIGALNNSWLDIKKLNALVVDQNYECGIIKIAISGEKNYLYINQSEKDLQDLKTYLDEKNLKIHSKIDNGLIKEFIIINK